MSELPPGLPRLRAIETYLRLPLDRVQQRVTEVEQWQATHRASARPSTPPDRTVQMNVGAEGRPVVVHHGECTVGRPRLRPVTRQGAIEALTAGVVACALCHPDRELRID
ncbi:DUF6233 domain-containing protein [Streptomyces kronopolitis]|uniref:DUF6233 domain-containing protein n=1 Tax=Streptomyces kronopolitis TaxID=1612435 RepID=UPI00367AC458